MSGYQVGMLPAAGASYQVAAQFVAESIVATKTRRTLNPSLRFEVADAKRALDSIAELQDDWDGYGARAVSKLTRLNAWHALDYFVSAGLVPEVSPKPNGTICFDWRSEGARSHFEVGKSRFSMFVETSRGTKFFEGEAKDLPSELKATLGSSVRGSSPTTSVTPINYFSIRGTTFA